MTRGLVALLSLGIVAALWACGGHSTLIGGHGDGDGDGDVDGDGDGDVDGDGDGDVDGDGDGDSCSGPGYPDDCALVSYFECGFDAHCEDGVIQAFWHQHIMCGDEPAEDWIFEYDCTHRCEHGCRDDDWIDWPSNGAELVAFACAAAPGDCEPGACRICSPPDYDGFGTQICHGDRTWSHCEESMPIGECFIDGWFSPAEQACLVMNGYCTMDLYDLDDDGDHWESLGACGGDGCSGGGPSPWTCVPGTCRVCDPPEYGGLGSQMCAEDGSGWSHCLEDMAVIDECRHVDVWYSPAVEECCIAAGYCCQDMWDRDGDGNTAESFGNCYEGGC